MAEPGRTALRVARPGEAELALDWMSRFNDSQGYPFDREATRRAFDHFVADPSLGRLWWIEVGDQVVGYLVLALGWSFEFGGRDAFVDEFFVDATERGRGTGARALALAIEEAEALGVRALHLEVEPHNPARHLYERANFRPDGRHLLTRHLGPPASGSGGR